VGPCWSCAQQEIVGQSEEGDIAFNVLSRMKKNAASLSSAHQSEIIIGKFRINFCKRNRSANVFYFIL
jgi:hypothetical protein